MTSVTLAMWKHLMTSALEVRKGMERLCQACGAPAKFDGVGWYCSRDCVGQPVESDVPQFDHAECARADAKGRRVHDPDIWFPSKGEVHKYEEARFICALCRHHFECALWAQLHREEGIWGGTTYQSKNPHRSAVYVPTPRKSKED
jgi:hypothetical protein